MALNRRDWLTEAACDGPPQPLGCTLTAIGLSQNTVALWRAGQLRSSERRRGALPPTCEYRSTCSGSGPRRGLGSRAALERRARAGGACAPTRGDGRSSTVAALGFGGERVRVRVAARAVSRDGTGACASAVGAGPRCRFAGTAGAPRPQCRPGPSRPGLLHRSRGLVGPRAQQALLLGGTAPASETCSSRAQVRVDLSQRHLRAARRCAPATSSTWGRNSK
jgi:hypothetical protein